MPNYLSHDVLVQQAQRGYNFLRDEGPRLGFNVNLLNPDTLEMSDGCYCALGETYEGGDYWDALERLADEGYPVASIDDHTSISLDARGGAQNACLTLLWERMHGFVLGYAEAPSAIKAYAALTDAWREVIKRERDQ